MLLRGGVDVGERTVSCPLRTSSPIDISQSGSGCLESEWSTRGISWQQNKDSGQRCSYNEIPWEGRTYNTGPVIRGKGIGVVTTDSNA